MTDVKKNNPALPNSYIEEKGRVPNPYNSQYNIQKKRGKEISLPASPSKR